MEAVGLWRYSLIGYPSNPPLRHVMNDQGWNLISAISLQVKAWLTFTLPKNQCSWCDSFQKESHREVIPIRNAHFPEYGFSRTINSQNSRKTSRDDVCLANEKRFAMDVIWRHKDEERVKQITVFKAEGHEHSCCITQNIYWSAAEGRYLTRGLEFWCE